MSDKKISQLPAVVSLTGSELVPVVQSGVTMSATAGQVGGAGTERYHITKQGGVVANGSDQGAAINTVLAVQPITEWINGDGGGSYGTSVPISFQFNGYGDHRGYDTWIAATAPLSNLGYGPSNNSYMVGIVNTQNGGGGYQVMNRGLYEGFKIDGNSQAGHNTYLTGWRWSSLTTGGSPNQFQNSNPNLVARRIQCNSFYVGHDLQTTQYQDHEQHGANNCGIGFLLRPSSVFGGGVDLYGWRKFLSQSCGINYLFLSQGQSASVPSLMQLNDSWSRSAVICDHAFSSAPYSIGGQFRLSGGSDEFNFQMYLQISGSTVTVSGSGKTFTMDAPGSNQTETGGCNNWAGNGGFGYGIIVGDSVYFSGFTGGAAGMNWIPFTVTAISASASGTQVLTVSDPGSIMVNSATTSGLTVFVDSRQYPFWDDFANAVGNATIKTCSKFVDANNTVTLYNLQDYSAGRRIYARLGGPQANLYVEGTAAFSGNPYNVRAEDADAGCWLDEAVYIGPNFTSIIENCNQFPRTAFGSVSGPGSVAENTGLLIISGYQVGRYEGSFPSSLHPNFNAIRPDCTGGITVGTIFDSATNDYVTRISFPSGTADTAVSSFIRGWSALSNAPGGTAIARAINFEIYNEHASQAWRMSIFHGGNSGVAATYSKGCSDTTSPPGAVTIWPQRWQRICMITQSTLYDVTVCIAKSVVTAAGSPVFRIRFMSSVDSTQNAGLPMTYKAMEQGIWRMAS